MNPVAPIFAAVCLALALITAWLLVRRFSLPKRPGRLATIDCLRGYLALFVYFHHSAVWYFYLRTGRFELPPSRLYTHLGQSSVGVFFMISGFLFFSKLLDFRGKMFDWRALLISRMARLLPLYLFVVCLVFLIVALLSHGVLKTSLGSLLISCLRWLTFTVFGAPDINGVRNTLAITSGVTWSLTYEWLFYLSLPAIGLVLSVRVPLKYVLCSLLAMAVALALRLPAIPLLAFVAGFVASIVVRTRQAAVIAGSRLASCAAFGCIFLTVYLFSQAYSPMPLILLSIAFVIVACGNSLFGALDSGTCKVLGDASYSMYLLHGVLLFCAFTFVVGITRAISLTVFQHWCICALCTPLLVLLSVATYRLIEMPGMRYIKRAASRQLNQHPIQ